MRRRGLWFGGYCNEHYGVEGSVCGDVTKITRMCLCSGLNNCPQTCPCPDIGKLKDKQDFVDAIKLKILSWGDYCGLGWTYCDLKGDYNDL